MVGGYNGTVFLGSTSNNRADIFPLAAFLGLGIFAVLLF
jgi:hypothetical protein